MTLRLRNCRKGTVKEKTAAIFHEVIDLAGNYDRREK